VSLNQLKAALAQKTTFEVVSATFEGGKVRLLGRVRPTQNTGMLLKVMSNLLAAADSADWNMDASKQYFLRNGRLTYGWRFIFQGQDIEANLLKIVAVIAGTKHVVQQLTEVRLHGGGLDRNVPSPGGKGAAPTGKARVGAARMLPGG
jgi:hypothetical protein